MKKNIISLIIIFFAIQLNAQNREHMAGVKWGYNLSNVSFTPEVAHEGIRTLRNYSVLYTYYHDIWQKSPYFGFQTGLSLNETGYRMANSQYTTDLYSIPLVSQFHVNFWKMRVLINLGAYGGYRTNLMLTDYSSSEPVPVKMEFDEEDYRLEFGFIAGGGLAFVLRPFELHLEANYNYSLTHLSDPRKGGATRPVYSYPNNLIFSAAIYFHLKDK
jgi:hypothetical protein